MDFSNFEWEFASSLRQAQLIQSLYGDPTCSSDKRNGVCYWNFMCSPDRGSGYKKCIVTDEQTMCVQVSVNVSIPNNEKEELLKLTKGIWFEIECLTVAGDTFVEALIKLATITKTYLENLKILDSTMLMMTYKMSADKISESNEESENSNENFALMCFVKDLEDTIHGVDEEAQESRNSSVVVSAISSPDENPSPEKTPHGNRTSVKTISRLSSTISSKYTPKSPRRAKRKQARKKLEDDEQTSFSPISINIQSEESEELQKVQSPLPSPGRKKKSATKGRGRPKKPMTTPAARPIRRKNVQETKTPMSNSPLRTIGEIG